MNSAAQINAQINAQISEQDAVDIDAAIVRHVQRCQPLQFADLAELFADAPAHGLVTETCLQALHLRLLALCTAGRLARMPEPRRRRRGSQRRRGRFIVPMPMSERGGNPAHPTPPTTTTEAR